MAHGQDVTLTLRLEPFGAATAILLTDEQVAQLGGGRARP